MPSTQLVFNTFVGGEVSPYTLGRTDLEKYYRSCRTVENNILRNVGGASSRPGFRRICLAKSQDGKRVRLKAMHSTANDVYDLEFGDFYMRVIYDGAQMMSGASPMEIATPYSHEHVFELHFAQIGDILHIAHANYYPRNLRNNNGVFTLSITKFAPPPSEPIEVIPASTLTPGALTGLGVTFTLGTASVLVTANIGQDIVNDSGPGRAVIVSITDTTHVVADIIEDFTNLTAIPSGSWHIEGAFNATMTIPSGGDKPVGKIVTLTVSNGFITSDMVGYFIKGNSGQWEITGVNSPASVQARILGEAIATGAVGAGSWSIESSAWLTEFPNTVCFHEDRLVFAKGNVIDLSRTDQFFNFAGGANDADAIRIVIASGDVVPNIQWITPGVDELLAGTDLGEMRVIGSGEGALTPNNAHPRPMTGKGSAPIQGLKLDSAVVFVEAGRDRVREMQFDEKSASFVSRDLTLLAEHIPKGNLVQMVRQRRPHEVVWLINGEKQLCGLKLDYVEQILAWMRETSGEILSCEVVHQFNDDAGVITKAPWEEIHAVIKRSINGVDTYFIECMDFSAINYPKMVTEGHYCQTDCAYTENSATPVSSVSVPWLVGEVVEVVGDGVERGTQTVPASGIVTVDPPALVVDVGLPFAATLETLPPSIAGGQTIMSRKKRWIEAFALVHKTLLAEINGERVDKTRVSDDVEVDPLTGRLTGIVKVTDLGYGTDATIKFVRNRPIQSTILAAGGILQVSDS